jgi:glycerophosphoryl diester phosphodiesterase
MRWLYSENNKTLVCGHRGHSIATPENTLAALTATKTYGGETAEIDTLLTADGEIILLHDQFLDRTTDGKGLADRMDLAGIRALDAGSWFDPRFAGERVPTLAEAIDHAAAIDIALVVEIKERRRLDVFAERLAKVLAETGGADRVIIISFDHVLLREMKAAIPGIQTEGITQVRHADFVQVARSAQLDSLSVEMLRFHPDDARALHAAGIAIRCHLPRPAVFEQYLAQGIDLAKPVAGWFAEGLMDSVSGDDVGWLADFRARVA